MFNHPFWDESGVGRDLQICRALEFVKRYGEYLHALEFNGMRPKQENEEVVALAERVQKPVVAGGDRHATEPNVVLNLTNSTTIADFSEEIRSGHSSVLITPAYREPLRQRILQQTAAVLANYPHHPRGWTRWDERVFHTDSDGITRSVAELWHETPPLIDCMVRSLHAVQHPHLQAAFRMVSAAIQPAGR